MATRSDGLKRNSNSPDFELDFKKDRESGIKLRVFAGTLAVLMLVGGFGGWAATAELSGAVIGQGQVTVDKDLRSIQHLDGGIIKSISVKKGELVAEGQVLFTLDGTQMKAEMQILKGQLGELLAKRQRLVAERDSLPQIQPIEDQILQVGVELSAFVGEMRLFKGNRENRLSQVKQLELGLAQSVEEANGLTTQLKTNKEEMALVQREVDKLGGLQKQGLVESSRVYAITRELTKLKGDRDVVVSNLDRLESRRNEIKLQIAAIEETAQTDAQKQLSEIEPRIAEIKERYSAVADRLTRMQIRSPVSGVINEVAVNTVGGVITPAQKLLTIVPENAILRIEVKIQPNDIDQLYVGQTAKLRFSAFSSRDTPELYGKISLISPATSTDPASGRIFYTAQVEVPSAELSKLGDKKLVPGMMVDTFIQTESRTALSYLVRPIVDQFERAFREH
jgi:HlyD family type I secretion membrane fusion protein